MIVGKFIGTRSYINPSFYILDSNIVSIIEDSNIFTESTESKKPKSSIKSMLLKVTQRILKWQI